MRYTINQKGKGYIGHFDSEAAELAPIDQIKRKLEGELAPAIKELSHKSESLDIVVAGTQIQDFLDSKAEMPYEGQVREAIREVFMKYFPNARHKFEFNDDRSVTHCILYVPSLDLILVADDSEAFRDAVY